MTSIRIADGNKHSAYVVHDVHECERVLGFGQQVDRY